MKNQREFLSNFAKEHEIKNPGDWRTVSLKKVVPLFYLISKHVIDTRGRRRNLIKSIQIESKEDVRIRFSRQSVYLVFLIRLECNFGATLDEKSPKAYWKVYENQRMFLNDFAKKNNIKMAKDWRYVTNDQVRSCPNIIS